MKYQWIGLAALVLAGPAFAQTPAAPTGPLDLPAVGRCVWDKLTDAQRTSFVSAAETQSRDIMTAALNALRSQAWFNLIDQCDERATVHDNALAVISAIVIQEGDGVLLQRAANLTREQVDAAIAAAPAESRSALEVVVRNKRAGRASPAGAASAAVLPIAQALNVPEPDKFMTTPAGQRLVSYSLDYVQTRIAAVEGNPR